MYQIKGPFSDSYLPEREHDEPQLRDHHHQPVPGQQAHRQGHQGLAAGKRGRVLQEFLFCRFSRICKNECIQYFNMTKERVHGSNAYFHFRDYTF